MQFEIGSFENTIPATASRTTYLSDGFTTRASRLTPLSALFHFLSALQYRKYGNILNPEMSYREETCNVLQRSTGSALAIQLARSFNTL